MFCSRREREKERKRERKERGEREKEKKEKRSVLQMQIAAEFYERRSHQQKKRRKFFFTLRLCDLSWIESVCEIGVFASLFGE